MQLALEPQLLDPVLPKTCLQLLQLQALLCQAQSAPRCCAAMSTSGLSGLQQRHTLHCRRQRPWVQLLQAVLVREQLRQVLLPQLRLASRLLLCCFRRCCGCFEAHRTVHRRPPRLHCCPLSHPCRKPCCCGRPLRHLPLHRQVLVRKAGKRARKGHLRPLQLLRTPTPRRLRQLSSRAVSACSSQRRCGLG